MFEHHNSYTLFKQKHFNDLIYFIIFTSIINIIKIIEDGKKKITKQFIYLKLNYIINENDKYIKIWVKYFDSKIEFNRLKNFIILVITKSLFFGFLCLFLTLFFSHNFSISKTNKKNKRHFFIGSRTFHNNNLFENI